MIAGTIACALRTAIESRDALEARLTRESDGPNAEDLAILTEAANRIVHNLAQLLVTAERRTP